MKKKTLQKVKRRIRNTLHQEWCQTALWSDAFESLECNNEKKIFFITKCLAALILTRPSRLICLSFAVELSSNAINVRQIGKFDSRITFTSSFEIVSRFFSRKPFEWYCTVSEKCLITKAAGEKERVKWNQWENFPFFDGN